MYRWVGWKVALRIRDNQIHYKDLIRDNDWSKTIQKDLDRTFPSHPLFSATQFKDKGQTALKNILVAFAVYKPCIGYCQGMNFVAGFLLIVSGFKEEETFKIFASLMCNKIPGDCLSIKGLEGLYQDNFPLLRILQSLFIKSLEKTIPKLKKHIQDIELPEELWLSKWFSTLFVYSLPLAHCIRIWDYMFAYGIISLLKVGIAILQYKEKELMKADFNECFELFKSLKEGHNLPTPEKLLAIADKVSIDCMELGKLRNEITKSVEDLIKLNTKRNLNAGKVEYTLVNIEKDSIKKEQNIKRPKATTERLFNFSNKGVLRSSIKSKDDSGVFFINEMNTLNDETNPTINFTVYRNLSMEVKRKYRGEEKVITANERNIRLSTKIPVKVSLVQDNKDTQN